MKVYQAYMCPELVQTIGSIIRVQHLPVHLQYSLPMPDADGGNLCTTLVEYPDDFDFEHTVWIPAIHSLPGHDTQGSLFYYFTG